MLKLTGVPIIQNIIQYYEKFKIKKIYVLSGYKSKIIEGHFKKRKNVEVIYSGLNSMTGGRLLYLKNILKNDFFCTYGDGLSTVNLKKLYNNHVKNRKIATLMQYTQFQDLEKLHLGVRHQQYVNFMKNPT